MPAAVGAEAAEEAATTTMVVSAWEPIEKNISREQTESSVYESWHWFKFRLGDSVYDVLIKRGHFGEIVYLFDAGVPPDYSGGRDMSKELKEHGCFRIGEIELKVE